MFGKGIKQFQTANISIKQVNGGARTKRWDSKPKYRPYLVNNIKLKRSTNNTIVPEAEQLNNT